MTPSPDDEPLEDDDPNPYLLPLPDTEDDVQALRKYRREAAKNMLAYLDSMANGEASAEEEDFWSIVELVREAAIVERRARRRKDRPTRAPEDIDFSTLLARTIRELRIASGKTSQEQLAQNMARLGFEPTRAGTAGWADERTSRIIRDIETGKRKVSLEELIGFALLFEVPLSRLLVGGLRPHERLRINSSLSLDANTEALPIVAGISPIPDTEEDTLELWAEDPLALLFPTRRVDEIMAGVVGIEPSERATERDWRPGPALRGRKLPWSMEGQIEEYYRLIHPSLNPEPEGD